MILDDILVLTEGECFSGYSGCILNIGSVFGIGVSSKFVYRCMFLFKDVVVLTFFLEFYCVFYFVYMKFYNLYFSIIFYYFF